MQATLPPALRALRLPLRLRLWDGQQLELGPEPRVTLDIMDPSLLALLASPRLDALASAYIEGGLDLHGPLPDVIALADQLSAAMGGAEARSEERRVGKGCRSGSWP